MFNLDPAKLLIIAVVAVILLGPDKLPQVAREGARGKPGTALASAPEAIRAYFRGNALRAQVNLEEAIAEFRSAIRIKPGDATAHNNMTRVRWPPSNAGSAGNGVVRQGPRPGPRSDLEHRLHKLNAGKCPICNGPGPIDARPSHVAWSIAFVPFWSSLTLVCCHSCGIRLRLGAIAFSVVFGLWGIPFCWMIPLLVHSRELGWIMMPLGLLRGLNRINFFVQVARNLKGVFFAPARQQAGRPGEAG